MPTEKGPTLNKEAKRSNDEQQLSHRYMQVEPIAELVVPTSDAGTRRIACVA